MSIQQILVFAVATTLVTFQIGFECRPGRAVLVGLVVLNPYAVAEDSVLMRGE